jgi:hypothetical protein
VTRDHGCDWLISVFPVITAGVPTKTTKTTKTAKAKKAPAKKTRAARPKKEAPSAGPRHAVFIDVENTSSEHALVAALDALAIDRAARPTELAAVGNWRAVGQQLARRLGGLGAQLVHSAPARGVRDWSDLWIAVAAGCWLGQSRPGDILEIVSNDKAFDAVGDAAAARGVIFRRLQHRRDTAAVAELKEPRQPKRARGKRGGRRRRRSRPEHPPATQSAAPRATALPPAHEPHGASRDQMIAVIGRLTDGQAGRWVNLDVLEKALKAEGFSRPPGSPRLVTRLRAIKDLEIDSHGRVRLALAPEST